MATVATETSSQSHMLERAVQRELLANEQIEIDSLVVRRVDDGSVCLQGVMHVPETGASDIESIVRQVAGVDAVLNRLVVRPIKSEG